VLDDLPVAVEPEDVDSRVVVVAGPGLVAVKHDVVVLGNRALHDDLLSGELLRGRTRGKLARQLTRAAELEGAVSEYAIRALDASTWDAFARLAEKHNGMGFGGCWCTWFHSRVGRPEGEMGRPWKERLVREGNAHAALVFDGEAAVAWAQYGSPDELPNIHHRKDYEATRTEELPDYRITCIFVDRDYRRKGVGGVALGGALDLIARAGGGVVEGYPQDLPQGKKISSSFLYNLTRSLYEQTGFSYDRPKGKNHCVMRRTVSPVKKPGRARVG
jgi:GNAT superfamily N-acetyltransferase